MKSRKRAKRNRKRKAGVLRRRLRSKPTNWPRELRYGFTVIIEDDPLCPK